MVAVAAVLGVCSSAVAEAAPSTATPAFRRVSLTPGHGHLRLRVETVAPWSSRDLSIAGDRELCVVFWTGDRAAPRSRICLDGSGERLALWSERLAADGSTTSARTLPVPVGRPNDRTAAATFTAGAIGLRQSVLFWQAVSRRGTCPEGCTDHMPAVGKKTLDLRARPRSLAAQFAPPVHPDSRDAAGGPLDVRRVAFGQSDLRLVLDVQTRGTWATRDLRRGRALCVLITSQQVGRFAARLCVTDGRRGAVLRYQPVDGQGREGAQRVIAATVLRPDDRSVHARFAPSALALPIGPFTWAAEARWRNGSTCRNGCTDRVPDSGAFASSVTALAEPRCFAAAARDPLHPCRNRSLRAMVFPRPAAAFVWPNSPCRRGLDPRRNAVFDPCEFGVTGSQSRATIALIGDSHAVHWRAALEVVAQAKRWRGVSISRPGCPFSTQIPRSPALGPGACAQLHRETLAWLRAQSDVHTIFISNWAQPPYGPQGGTGGYGGNAGAFGAMLDMIPATVRHIYVLRDIPGTTLGAISCVQARRRHHQPLRNACSVYRSAVLTGDPGAAAVASRRPRVQVIDLTRFFCAPSRCYPVIGGAYVYKDDNHMNAVFSTSLGPFVLRALRTSG